LHLDETSENYYYRTGELPTGPANFVLKSREEVDYVLTYRRSSWSAVRGQLDSVSLKNDDANRALMGSNMQRQGRAN